MDGRQLHITPKLVDSLYTEAMILADEARAYFDQDNDLVLEGADPVVTLAFTCESLKVTTRLMQCIAWLLNAKAYFAGELSAEEMESGSRSLGAAPPIDEDALIDFPEPARALIWASGDLYERLSRLDRNIAAPAPAPVETPVHAMLRQIEGAF